MNTEQRIQRLEIENKRQNCVNISLAILLVILTIVYLVNDSRLKTQSKRLDAHKEVIELQQKQINQLIINAKYDKQK